MAKLLRRERALQPYGDGYNRRRKAKETIRSIRSRTQVGELHYHLANLSSPDETRHLVGEIASDYDRLNVLINNVGG